MHLRFSDLWEFNRHANNSFRGLYIALDDEFFFGYLLNEISVEGGIKIDRKSGGETRAILHPWHNLIPSFSLPLAERIDRRLQPIRWNELLDFLMHWCFSSKGERRGRFSSRDPVVLRGSERRVTSWGGVWRHLLETSAFTFAVEGGTASGGVKAMEEWQRRGEGSVSAAPRPGLSA